MASVTLASRCISPVLSGAPFIPEINTSNTRDDDFSLYFKLIRENFPPELANSALDRSSIRVSLARKRNDDGEIGIFTAEKYFNGGMDDDEKSWKHSCTREGTKPISGTGSTMSESTGNSKSTLLRDRRQPPTAKWKGFMGVFWCPCSGKDAVEVGKGGQESNKTDHVEFEMGRRRMERRSSGSTPAVAGSEFGSGWVRSLGVLNPAGKGGVGLGARDDDVASEASSDLFEIESLSINTHPFFRPERSAETSSTTCYEPSEASIEWSVATASAANISEVTGGEANKVTRQHRTGLLLGCASEKAVETTAGPDRREGSQREGSLTPVARYHAVRAFAPATVTATATARPAR